MVFRPVTRDPNIGKVATANFAKVSAEVDRVVSSATTWYDGTLASIEARLARLKSASVAARTVLAGTVQPDMMMYHLAKLQDFVGKAEQEISSLQRVASEFVDVDTQEAIQSLPTYRIAVAGAHRNLGERVAASKTAVEPIRRGSELHEFLHVEPRAFVRENQGLSKKQLRTAAVAYVEQKTAYMANQQVLRSHVVDEFVKRVELLINAG